MCARWPATLGPAGIRGGDPAAVADTVAAQSVTGRFTSPGEIADRVLFLASPGSANITGADHIIDGGMITTT
ncbi:SDR family oxidoreductase [Nocardia albiluteola]|uniref:SDR family oxidoreductase n=1 Tax=Nocardia albiluteola TaxID=2842303 RepID=UPI002479A0E3|nr:SDR family oxidoreductase [Nocardia albiluteola]